MLLKAINRFTLEIFGDKDREKTSSNPSKISVRKPIQETWFKALTPK